MGSLISETPYSEITATLELLGQLGVDREALKQFRKAPSLLQKEVAYLIKRGDCSWKRKILTIDHRQTKEQVIAICGPRSEVRPHNLQLHGEGIVQYEWRLFHFGMVTRSDKAIEAITCQDGVNPWSLGRIEHLIAFKALHSDGELWFPVVSLHLSSDVWVISGNDGSLLRASPDGPWADVVRFLAVRPVFS